MQPLQDGITHPLCTANWLGFEANNYPVTLIMLSDITWNLLTKIVNITLLIEIRGVGFVYHIVYPHWLLQIICLQINWVVQLGQDKWCPEEVIVLCVSTNPTPYLKLSLESHLQCDTSSASLWSTQWSTQICVTWCAITVSVQLSVIQGLVRYHLQWGCCTVLRGNSDSTWLVTYPVLITVRIYRLILLLEDFWVGSRTVKQTEKHLFMLTA